MGLLWSDPVIPDSVAAARYLARWIEEDEDNDVVPFRSRYDEIRARYASRKDGRQAIAIWIISVVMATEMQA